MRQGSTITAKSAFTFKASGTRGRAVTVRSGDKFWITNCETDQARQGVVMIDRTGRGHISHGYAFQPEILQAWFEVAA